MKSNKSCALKKGEKKEIPLLRFGWQPTETTDKRDRCDRARSLLFHIYYEMCLCMP